MTIMKTMKCKQLGGACDLEFHAESFEEIAEMSKMHGMEMYQKGDKAHLLAMEDMRERMKFSQAMNEWLERKREEFDALPDQA